mgnify:CR=1 FL=1
MTFLDLICKIVLCVLNIIYVILLSAREYSRVLGLWIGAVLIIDLN